MKYVFSRTVDEHAIEHGITVLEAIMELRDEFGIDEDDLPKCLSDHLIQKLKVEAGGLRLIRDRKASISSFFE